MRLLNDERQSLLSFVLFSQNFVREAKMDRISLSIRGILFQTKNEIMRGVEEEGGWKVRGCTE